MNKRLPRLSKPVRRMYQFAIASLFLVVFCESGHLRKVKAAEECRANVQKIVLAESEYGLYHGNYASIVLLRQTPGNASLPQNCPLDGNPYRIVISHERHDEVKLEIACPNAALHVKMSGAASDYQITQVIILCEL